MFYNTAMYNNGEHLDYYMRDRAMERFYRGLFLNRHYTKKNIH